MRLFWTICISLLLIIFISQSFKIKEQENAIAGIWKIYKIETLDTSTGEWKDHDWMKGGVGLLHYDHHQTMSLHFTPKGYSNSSDTSLKMISKAYWYIGKYHIIPDKKIIEHQRIMHSKPSEWGKAVQRTFEFSGDTLVLSPIEYNMRLKWLKLVN